MSSANEMSCYRDFVIGRLRFVKNFTGRKPSSPPRSTAGSFRKKNEKRAGVPPARVSGTRAGMEPIASPSFDVSINKSLENDRDVLFSWVPRIITRQNHDTIGQRSVNRSISSSPGWYDIGGADGGKKKKDESREKRSRVFFFYLF